METNIDYRQCFEYPIDSATLIGKKNKIKKFLLNDGHKRIEKRIAILGGSTTNEIADQLGLFLLNYDINASFYQSEFGQYWQDAMFGVAELDNFHPDIIYIHTNWRNIESFPCENSTQEEVSTLLDSEYRRFVAMWDSLEKKFHCPIIQNNFDRPNFRLLGNRDIWDFKGRSNFIAELNSRIYKYAQNHESFYVNDIDYLAADFGVTKWNDSYVWNMYKYCMPIIAIPKLANSLAAIIKSIYGKNKKVLALDLDNTLWGGVIGDDGVEGIKIGPELSDGQVFSEFQKYCKLLKGIGVVLTINSKNDMSNAIAGLNHPDSVLKEEDFVEIKANWEPKSQNLIQIANDLNLGVDSFVFVDDNPAEREIVRCQVPGVSTPIMNAPENYIETLDHSGFFEVTTLSKEDLQKTEIYKANVKRQQEIHSYSSYDEYLDNLEMVATIGGFEDIQVQRISQLTNKSNQFNLTTLRCTEDDIRRMGASNEYICLCGRLNDKFGDNGIVAVTVGKIIDKSLHINLWLMSCRVLKRGMEDAMMNELMKIANKKEIETVIGYYYPTIKNGMVKEFYKQFGFSLDSEEDGNLKWIIKVSDYHKREIHMLVKGE